MPLQAFRPASAVSEPGWYPVLLIDPGHGGTDGGAVSKDGTIESTLNLAIAQKLNGIASFYGIPTVMTRNSEEIQYPDTADTISAKKNYSRAYYSHYGNDYYRKEDGTKVKKSAENKGSK